MKILLIILISFFTLNINAAVTVSSVTNSSNEVDLTLEQGEVLEILGGISGSYKCTGETTTIDSCALAQNRSGCNKKTICTTTNLQIELKSDSKSGTVVLVNGDNTPLTISNHLSYTSGSTRTINIDWADICAELDAGTNCSTPGKVETLKLGINEAGDETPEDYISIKFGIYSIGTTIDPDTNGNPASLEDATLGVTDYYLMPGDEKVVLKHFETVDGGVVIPNAAEIVRLRAFYAIGNCAQASASPYFVNNGEDSFEIDLDKTDKGILDNRLDGLTNGEQYVFMIGLEDKAGNIGRFKDLTANCEDSSTGLTNTAGQPYNRHSAIPQEVYGLLEENQNCYITTAAYGSPLHSKVVTFKKFRDHILTKFDFGKKLIHFYYKTSPPIAEVIRENKFLKLITQAVLWPAWAISAAVLYMGLMPFLFVVIMSVLTVIFILVDRKSKKAAKFVIALLVFAGFSFSQKTFAQDEFFSTQEKATAESAPNEPPYNGTENDEFSDLEESTEDTIQAEEEYEPEIEAPTKTKSSASGLKESPDKWKPYQRVPEPKRLEELADEGLIKITKKGGYEYDVKGSEQTQAASFRFGMASFPYLRNEATDTDFSDVYGDNKKPVLLIDYEWQFFQAFGKLAIKVGSGLMYADGNGRFKTTVQTPNGPTDEAEEKYSFFMFPNSLSAVYRLDIFNKQWLVPFGEVGVDYFGFIETRDDGGEFKFGGSPHFHFAVGGSFLLDVLGKDMIAEIDRQYGINHMWLTAEYRRLESMGGNFDFSDDLVNAGFMFEF